MSGAPGVRLALPVWPGDGGRRSPWRRALLGLGLLALAVLAALLATGTIGPPETGSIAAAPEQQVGPARQAAPRATPAGADLSGAQAQRRAEPPAPGARPASDRVVAATNASALFAKHSWYVPRRPPPPPPAPPAPPPPEPTAPPFPYAFVGSYTPQGERPVFFLARGDRVVDAHVGDKLDGVYQLESAGGGQLVFVYLPLDIRQSLPLGVAK